MRVGTGAMMFIELGVHKGGDRVPIQKFDRLIGPFFYTMGS